MRIVGWDIGAVNVKAVLLGERGEPIRTASQAFEIWRDRERLGEVLQTVLNSLSSGIAPCTMAVTMTAELSDAFETKREGVLFVLAALERCFSTADISVFNLSGDFAALEEARKNPLDYAASNWLATALWTARKHPDCLVLDVGSTTTDILPIAGGIVCTTGRSDLDRLASGELIYTGALRTNVAAIVQSIPIADKICGVASEYFSISGDVHLILGNLNPGDYTCPTPDGRPPSIVSARARLARLVCADSEMLSPDIIDGMARHIYACQVGQICAGIEQVLSRHPMLRKKAPVIFGSGSFLGVAAAKRVGLDIDPSAAIPDGTPSSVMPCLAVAHLLQDYMRVKSR